MTTPSDQTITKETTVIAHCLDCACDSYASDTALGPGCCTHGAERHVCAAVVGGERPNAANSYLGDVAICEVPMSDASHRNGHPAGVAQEAQPAQCEPVFRGDALVWCKTHSRDFGECRRAAQPAQCADGLHGPWKHVKTWQECERCRITPLVAWRKERATNIELQSRLTAATDALVKATPILSGLDFNLADAITDLARLNTTLDARLTAALKERDAETDRISHYRLMLEGEREQFVAGLTAAEERERKLVEALRDAAARLTELLSFGRSEITRALVDRIAALLEDRSKG